jgi:acetoin utilization protein AcuB
MNAFAPISTIMSSDLVTVNPEDNLLIVKKLFESHTFHHLPVVRFRKIVGIISKTDLNILQAH